jgi:thiol-disulfide isomerase/thioredoxin
MKPNGKSRIHYYSKCFLPVLSLVSLGFLLQTTALFADDTSVLLADFKKNIEEANPDLAKETYVREHPNPPTEQEVQNLVEKIGLAAVKAIEEWKTLERQYPQSTDIPSVHDHLANMLGSTFGMEGLPIPQNHVDDVEGCVKRLLLDRPHDIGLYLVLCRVAASLTDGKQLALYQELSREPTPEPARSQAQKALLDLERLGKPLDISFIAADGRKVSLAELKGKVILIDFWSTTCLPCVRMLPDLKSLYAKHNVEGFEVIGISLDSDKDVLTRFVEKHEIPWPDYFDALGFNSPLAKAYGINGIPVLWLVDRHGLLRHLDARQQLEQKVEALLKER